MFCFVTKKEYIRLYIFLFGGGGVECFSFFEEVGWWFVFVKATSLSTHTHTHTHICTIQWFVLYHNYILVKNHLRHVATCICPVYMDARVIIACSSLPDATWHSGYGRKWLTPDKEHVQHSVLIFKSHELKQVCPGRGWSWTVGIPRMHSGSVGRSKRRQCTCRYTV